MNAYKVVKEWSGPEWCSKGSILEKLQKAKELVPLKQVVKLRRDLSANDTSRHPKLLKIGPNHQCQ